jgi:CheY-like chemotaxis protein
MSPALQWSLRALEAPLRPGRIERLALALASRRSRVLECAAEAGPVSVVAWARGRGQELLFVDGNHFLLELTARAFRGVGATCRTAPTPDEAIRVLERDARIRAAILDYEMPRDDVGELVRRMRALRPAIRLIGTSDRDRRREFARRGVHQFVPKPWGFADLVAVTGR